MEKSRIFREFSFNNQEFYVKTPSLNILREAKYAYAKSFTDAIKRGFLTKKKMEITLMQADPEILKEYTTRRAEILKSMMDAEEEMGKAQLSEDLEYLAEVMSIYRNTLLQEDMNLSSLFSNTADQLAEDDKINFLVFSLIYKKTGEQVWKTISELLEAIDDVFIEACKYQIMCLDYNLKPDWDKDLPEYKTRTRALEMRTLEEKAKETETVAIEDKKEEDKPKKKRTRKPKVD